MIKAILLATNNDNKVIEIKDIISRTRLKGFKVFSLKDLHEEDDVAETGETFSENAFLKAHYYANKYDFLVVSDDSGLMVDALDGKPGVYSKRYSEPNPTSEKNRKKLLQVLENVSNRKAHFRSCICLIDEKKETHFFYGETSGYIMDHEEGYEGFGYDAIFYSLDLQKPFGLASIDEKSRVSHRGKAIRDLVEYLEETYGE